MYKRIIACVLCFCLVFAAVPFAAFAAYAGGGFGGGGGGAWGTGINSAYGGQSALPSIDEFLAAPPPSTDWKGLGALGLSAITGLPNYAVNYFMGGDSASGGGSTGGSGAGRGEATGKDYTSNVYNGGNTTNNSIFNTANNTAYINTINNTTNNTWNQYEISNVYYNNEYNTYNVQTTNNYNYYITYSPTYVTVVDYSEQYESYNISTYFYQLPDGRNSFDLTAEDVWGTVFTYDAVNYDYVPEDDGTTLALYHFDGDFKDSSSNALLGSSPVVNFVEDGLGGCFFSNGILSVITLPTPNDFDMSVSPWTIEYRVKSNALESTGYILLKGIASRYTFSSSFPSGVWNSVAFCYDGSTYSLFLNGCKINLTQKTESFPPDYTYMSGLGATAQNFTSTFQMACSGGKSVSLDELRISKGVLYTDNYTPRAQPFDTNNVFVLPAAGHENDLAVASLIPVSDYRFGGVRPTYPTNGYVTTLHPINKVKEG